MKFLIAKEMNNRMNKALGKGKGTYTTKDLKDWKFYYSREEGILIGHRSGNFYYGNINRVGCVCMFMSRYLPWGTTRNGYTYPREPRRIPSFIFWIMLKLESNF